MTGEDWPTSLKFANACGAFAVSRHGCTPAYPSLEELHFFPSVVSCDLICAMIPSSNSCTGRPRGRGASMATGRPCGYSPSTTACSWSRCPVIRCRRERHSGIVLAAALRVQAGKPGYGILCDSRIGRSALHRASGSGLWIGRPAEWPGSRPLTAGARLGTDCGTLSEWAREDVVKVLCFCHPDDDAETHAAQEQTVKRLFEAARRNRLEFLLEIIPSKVGRPTIIRSQR